MTVQDLLQKALQQLGNTTPTPDQYSDALFYLNVALNTVTYWDDSLQPITELTSLSGTVNLPYTYTACLMYETARLLAPSYGADPLLLEQKASELAGKMTYPNASGSLRMNACVTEVI